MLVRQIEEESAERGELAAVADAGQWLDRAGAAIAQRLADLKQLAPWAKAIERLVRRDSGPGSALTLAGSSRGVRGVGRARRRPRALELRAAIDRSVRTRELLIDRAIRLAELADDFVEETELGFLFSASGSSSRLATA